ncbi:MAG: hypothetical protein QUS33_12510 [Dehalococcoidia bacterium]|nr:hypothetical protein [Dehalococcoidia bacterium]
MSRTLKIAAVVIALAAVLALLVTTTIYAFGGDRCGLRSSGCATQWRESCLNRGGCQEPDGCPGPSRCNPEQQP